MTPTVTGTDRLKQVLASSILLTATVGVPVGLSLLVGWPLPTSLSELEGLPRVLNQPLPSSAVVDVLAALAWLAWLHVTAGIGVELLNATARRGRPQLRIPFGGPSQDLARSLVITALLVGVTAPLAPATANPAAAAAPPSVATSSADTSAADTASDHSSSGDTSTAVAANPAAVTGAVVEPFDGSPTPRLGRGGAASGAERSDTAVPAQGGPERAAVVSAAGDVAAEFDVPEFVVPAPAAGRYACLWDIAEQQLGDGTRWSEIHDLNVGRTQPDGQQLDDPDLIRPGWRLLLPPHAPHTDAVAVSTAAVPGGHLVVPGDTLWAIAETELGDGARYGELAAAAATLTQPDGTTLHDPDVLQPGWTIPIPEDQPATDDPPGPPRQPAPTPDRAPDDLVPAPLENDPPPTSPTPAEDGADAREQTSQAAADSRRDLLYAPDAALGQPGSGGPDVDGDPGADLDADLDVHRGGAGATGGVDGEAEGEADAPAWALPGLSGAGTMLAGALLLLLRQQRRRQSRLRRPGRTLAMPTAEHAVVEKSVRAHSRTATTIERLHEILRRLAATHVHSGEPLPAVTAVTLDRSGVTLHLARPAAAVGPWTAAPGPLRWHLPGDVGLDRVGPSVPDQPPPFPLLVTVGVTLDGATTMLNLEHLGTATVTGDRQRGEDLLRYVAAEIGCNPWSDAVRAQCVGVAQELGPLNPDRIRVSPAPRPDAATDTGDVRDMGGAGDAAGGAVGPVADLTADAVAVVDRSRELGMDVPDARIRQAGEETWPPRLLLTDTSRRPDTLHTLTNLIRAHPSRTGMTVLVLAAGSCDADTGTDAETGTDPHTAADAVAHGDGTLHVSGAGHLTVTSPTGSVLAGVTAAGLSAAEAQGCAALYALGAADAPMPTAHPAIDGWRAYTDAAGALTTDHTLPRHTPQTVEGERDRRGLADRTRRQAEPDASERARGWLLGPGVDAVVEWKDGEGDVRGDEDGGDEAGGYAAGGKEAGHETGEYETGEYETGGYETGGHDDGAESRAGGYERRWVGGAVSVLGASDAEYLEVAATTREDLDALAPRVPDEVRRAVAETDPGLDDDVAAWFADSAVLPRLTLLGPVGARTRGVQVAKRKPYYTELLAYLATRPHGATPEEVAAAFDISSTKARGYVATVRDWLGTNPRTGRAHIPDARHSPAAEHRGVGVYEVQDLLVDADLFRRLRLRGQTRGPDGIHDLQRALTLVTGPPFSRLRPGGWTWLAEGDRLDQHMVCAIVDVAHLATTHLLRTGDLDAARATAELAALTAPDEEIPRLDLAAVAMAAGHRRAAADIVSGDICNRSDDAGPPEELSARTQAILERHGWLTDPRQAAS